MRADIPQRKSGIPGSPDAVMVVSLVVFSAEAASDDDAVPICKGRSRLSRGAVWQDAPWSSCRRGPHRERPTELAGNSDREGGQPRAVGLNLACAFLVCFKVTQQT